MFGRKNALQNFLHLYLFGKNSGVFAYIYGLMTHNFTSVLSISVIPGQCLDDNERLCAREVRLRLRKFHLEISRPALNPLSCRGSYLRTLDIKAAKMFC